MAEIIYTKALTTVARIKDRLGLTNTNNDTLLLRVINGVTDQIEGYCGRKFLRATYTEIRSIQPGEIAFLVLKNAPVASITSFEYNSGLIASPTWSAFPSESYALSEDGESGIIELTQILPNGIPNSVRVVYVAGYLIDWSNAGASTHTLPADLTEVAEQLVTRYFKRRENEGKQNESFNGASISYLTDLTEEQKEVLNRYKRTNLFLA